MGKRDVSRPVLEIEQLTMRFGGLVAVDSVSFSLGQNEILGLIGPNGAGKTTIFNSVCGSIKPTSGRVLLRGTDITGLPPHKIAAVGIARTFQNVRLFGQLSLRENIMAGAYRAGNCGLVASMLRFPVHRRMEQVAQARAEIWLDRLSLRPYAELSATALPLGLQRVAEVARAMASEPSVVLLDEPGAGLNALEKARLSEILKSIVVDSDCSLLLVEHDMPMVMSLVDRVAVLHYGRKIADGAPDLVREESAVMEAYLGV